MAQNSLDKVDMGSSLPLIFISEDGRKTAALTGNPWKGHLNGLMEMGRNERYREARAMLLGEGGRLHNYALSTKKDENIRHRR